MRVPKNWQVRGIQNLDTRYGAVTWVLLRHVKTGHSKVEKIDGTWTREQLGI